MVILTNVDISEEVYRIFLAESERRGMASPEKLMEQVLQNYAQTLEKEASCVDSGKSARSRS